MATMLIVDPAAEHAAHASNLASRLTTLAGKRIGIVNNSKYHSDAFLDEVERLLVENHGVVGFARYQKGNASVAMSADALAKLAAECDAVVHGVAD